MWEDGPQNAVNDILEHTDVGGRELFGIVHGGENVIFFFSNRVESDAGLSKKSQLWLNESLKSLLGND